MPPVVVGVAAAAASVIGGVTILGLGVAATAAVIGVGAALTTKLAMDAMTPDLGGYATDPVQDQALNTTANDVRKIVYGEALVGGKIVGYAKPTIGSDDYHIMVLHLVGHPCESVELYELEGKASAEVSSAVSTEIHLGDQTETSSLANQYIDGWTSEHVGYDQTYVVLKIKIDDELFPSGVNEAKFIVRGHRVYDPRKDSSQGGDGTHTFEDESTWEWSDNPALCAYDCLRRYGARPIPQRRIPIDFMAVAASYCDELVSFTDLDGNAATGTRFSVNGVLNNGMRQQTMLSHILSTMGGKIYRPSGKIYFKPAMYAGPATTVIDVSSADDFPVYRPHRPFKEKINTVKTEYLSPSHKYQMTNAPVVSSEEYKTQDGAYLESSHRFTLVNKDHQAQRLGKLAMERSRAGFLISHSMHGVHLDIVPGNNIVFRDAETGINKEFTVEQARFDAARHKTDLELIEDSPAIYPDSFEPAEGDLTPNTSLPDATAITAPINLTWSTTPEDSWRQGVLRWEHPSPNNVINYVVSVSNANEETPQTQLTFNPAMREQSLAHLPLGTYFVAVSARNRFKVSQGAAITINIGVPSTPTQGVVVNKLPGRVIITGPTLPHNSATYEWRYSFDGSEAEHFNAAINPGRNESITVTNTPHNGILHVWYRLVDGDQVDPDWRYFAVNELIGTTADFVDPLVISNIEIPELGKRLGLTLEHLTADIQNQNSVNADLIAFKNGIHASLISQASDFAIQKYELITLNKLVGTKSIDLRFEEYTALQFGYTNDDGEFVDGALAEHLERLTYESSDGDRLSIYQYFQLLEDQIGDVSGQIQLGIVDESELFTGLQITAGALGNNFRLYMDNLDFASRSGEVFFSLNTITGRLEIGADTEFKGTLTAPRKVVVRQNYMLVEDHDGFGVDGDLAYWKGPPILTPEGEPDYDALSKANATFAWEDIHGQAYLAQGVSSGIYNTTRTNSSLALNQSIEIGPFETNGNPKTLTCTLMWFGSSSYEGLCDIPAVQPSCTLTIERKIGNGGWTTLQTHNISEQVTQRELFEPELSSEGWLCYINESVNKSFTITDTDSSSDTFSYRARVTNQIRYHAQLFVRSQSLTLSSFEERPTSGV